MSMFKIEQIENPCKRMKEYFTFSPFESDCIKWLEENISFEDDVSAERSRLDFSLFPYQVQPIRYACDLNGRKECTLVMMEQRWKDECNANGDAI